MTSLQTITSTYSYAPTPAEIEKADALARHPRWVWDFMMPIYATWLRRPTNAPGLERMSAYFSFVGGFSAANYPESPPGADMHPAFWHPAMYGFLRANFLEEARRLNIQLGPFKGNMDPEALVDALLSLWALSPSDNVDIL